MKNQPIAYLVARAQQHMTASSDPVHDLGHTKRVVMQVKHLSRQLGLSKEQKEALILAAWWHDVSRKLTKKPSFIWMPLVDDLLSAIMLWRETIRQGLFGSVAGMAARVIFCKSLGTGAILTRLLIRKRNRVMVHTLRDADFLDGFCIERMQHILTLAESSRVYHTGYRVLVRWFASPRRVRMKTSPARVQVAEQFTALCRFMNQDDVLHWHIEQYGSSWVEKNILRSELLLSRLSA